MIKYIRKESTNYKHYPDKCGVYKLLNKITGNFYIGSTSNFALRKREHWHKLKQGKHYNDKLQEDYNLFGRDSFEFSVLLVCDRQNVKFYEQCVIDKFNPTYNICKSAYDSSGYKHSKETRDSISKIRTERKLGRKLGTKMPPEFGAKLSAMFKGKNLRALKRGGI